jgi:hypothetical protein
MSIHAPVFICFAKTKLDASTGGCCEQFMALGATLDQYTHALNARFIDRFNRRIIKGSINSVTFNAFLYNGRPGTE